MLPTRHLSFTDASILEHFPPCASPFLSVILHKIQNLHFCRMNHQPAYHNRFHIDPKSAFLSDETSTCIPQHCRRRFHIDRQCPEIYSTFILLILFQAYRCGSDASHLLSSLTFQGIEPISILMDHSVHSKLNGF